MFENFSILHFSKYDFELIETMLEKQDIKQNPGVNHNPGLCSKCLPAVWGKLQIKRENFRYGKLCIMKKTDGSNG